MCKVTVKRQLPHQTGFVALTTTLLVVSEMTYTVSSGTLNSTIPYHTIPYHTTTLLI